MAHDETNQETFEHGAESGSPIPPSQCVQGG